MPVTIRRKYAGYNPAKLEKEIGVYSCCRGTKATLEIGCSSDLFSAFALAAATLLYAHKTLWK